MEEGIGEGCYTPTLSATHLDLALRTLDQPVELAVAPRARPVHYLHGRFSVHVGEGRQEDDEQKGKDSRPLQPIAQFFPNGCKAEALYNHARPVSLCRIY